MSQRETSSSYIEGSSYQMEGWEREVGVASPVRKESGGAGEQLWRCCPGHHGPMKRMASIPRVVVVVML